MWIGGGFNLPEVNALPEPKGSYMHAKFGGKNDDTKYARSMTPRGFAIATFMANDAGVGKKRPRRTGIYSGPAVAPRPPAAMGKERETLGKRYES